jgi:hypothetical protein
MKKIIFSSLLALILLGCKSVNVEIPKNYNILIGSGGGSTGLWEGYIIQSDTQILSWKGRKAGDNPTFLKNYTNEFPKKIWEIVQKDSLSNVKYQNPGNLSYIIKISVNDSINTIIWDPFLKNDTINKLNASYEKILKLISK